MRRASRVDGNHSQIRRAFEQFGCWVGDLHDLGRGWPDLLVSVPSTHLLVLVEVKDGSKPPSKRKLTPDEQEFHKSCPSMIWTVKDLDDVKKLVGYYRYG